MYKNRKVSYSLLIMLTFFLFFVVNVEYASCEENFEVEITPGFNGYAKYNHLAPFKIKIKNNGEDFIGKIKILLQENYGSKRLYTSYSKNISIAKGTTKSFDIDVLINNRFTPAFKIRIVNEKDSILWKDVVYIDNLNDPNDLAIGILSDDKESLNYFGLISNDAERFGKKYYKTIDINGYINENAALLNTFNAIVINDYDTGLLNKEQISTLEEWVKQGGVLIIGTGPNYKKTLRGFEKLNIITVNGLDKVNAEFETPLTVIDAEIDNGIQFLKNGEKVLVYKRELGDGNIFITTFDMGLKPFIDWKQKEDFINTMLKSSLNYYGDEKEIMNNFRLHGIENITKSIPFNKMPSLKFIIGIIIAFILTVGPINYFILKKIDKRELGWITIPSITIIFILIIYLWGFGIRFDKPLINNVSIIELNDSGNIGKVKSVSGIVSFKNGDINISKEGKNDILIIPNGSATINLASFKDEDVYLEYIDDRKKHIVFRNASIWQVLPIMQDTVIDFEQFIDLKLSFEESKVIGNITNNSSIPLEDIVLIMGNSFVEIGDLDKGQSREIDFDVKSFSHSINNPSGFYGLLDSMYPMNSGRAVADEDNDILNSIVKREILSQYYNLLRQNQITYNMKLVAWNREPITEDIYVNNKTTERLDRNLFIMPMSFNYKEDSVIDIPYGILQPEIVELNNMHYQYDGISLFSAGKGHAVFMFKPDDRLQVNTMGIKVHSMNIDSLSIFNYRTNQWDEYTDREIIIDESNKEYYLYNQLGIKIKVEVESRTNIQIPHISLKGVVR